MTTGYALAIKRLYGPGIVRVAAKHNLREIAAEIGVDGHIDPSRIGNNIVLRGPPTADGVTQLAKSLMDAAGVIKCRKTAVMCLELLFTLPAGTTIDLHQYFEQATSWAERHFGVPVLSCVAHADEGSPHAHALLLPLVGGRMGGSDLHGGKAKLWAMQTSFHDEVGARHGLPRQKPQQRLSAAVRTAALAAARASLQANSALTDAVVDALLLPHARAPEALLVALGLTMPTAKPKGKSFVSIMTAPSAPESRNPLGKAKGAQHNPIGIDESALPLTCYPYTCVGIGFSTAPNFSAGHQPIAAGTVTQRQPAVEHPAPSSLLDQRQQAAIPWTPTGKFAKRQVDGEVVPANATGWHNRPQHPASGSPQRSNAGPQPAPQRHSAEHHGPDSAPAESEAIGGDYQRQRDDSEQTAFWDPERGEFTKPRIRPSGRELADSALQAALQWRTGRQTEERARVHDAKSHNELLELHYGERMDPRAKNKAGSIDYYVAPLGSFNWPSDTAR